MKTTTLLLLAAVLLGCDASSDVDDGGGGAGGAGGGVGGAGSGSGSSLCSGELVVAGSREPLRCARGAFPLGHGMYEVDFEGAESGAGLRVTFASVETGTYTVPDCIASTLALAGTYSNATVDRRDLRIELIREGETLRGSLRGEHCRSLGANPGDGSLTYRCTTVELTSFSVPLEPDVAVDCEPPPDSDGYCNVGVTIDGACNYLSCPAGAPVCDVE